MEIRSLDLGRDRTARILSMTQCQGLIGRSDDSKRGNVPPNSNKVSPLF
jgi:hypothetical protein